MGLDGAFSREDGDLASWCATLSGHFSLDGGEVTNLAGCFDDIGGGSVTWAALRSASGVEAGTCSEGGVSD